MSNEFIWYSMLPEHLRPPKETTNSLEKLRLKYSISNDMLVGGISVSPWAAVKALGIMKDRFCLQYPEKGEKEIWQGVILSWFEGLIKYQFHGIPPQHIIEELESIEKNIDNFTAWKDVVNFILTLEKAEMGTDYSGIQDEINKILFI